MDELDKTVSGQDTANHSPASQEAESHENSVKENCEAAEVCVEKESPALDIEAVADEQDGENSESVKKVFSMSKDEILAELKNIVDTDRMDAHKEVSALKMAFYNIRSKEALEELNAYVEAGNDPAAFSSNADESEAEFKELYSTFKERRASYLEAEEARKQKNLEEKRRVLDSMKAIAGDIDNVNMKFPEFQQLQTEFKAIKEIPAPAETDIWKEFQNVVEEFYDHLKMNKELRDLDFKKNLEAKRALIEEAKKLDEMSDTIAAFRRLQELHDEWRELGPVAKELRDEIWDEFKAASTVINKRHQDYFERRKAEELANQDAKTALCEQAEAIDTDALTSFAQWDEATKGIIELQKKWKEYGFAPKKTNTLLFTRFRKACDDFFSKKTEFFKKTREDLNANLEKKTALCEKAESLKDSDDFKNTTEAIVKLQAEWKSIGGVPRKYSDAIWQRFTAACNAFFDRKKKETSDRRQEENANLAAKKEIIEKLKAIPEGTDRKEVLATLRGLQAEWQKIGFVPFRQKDKVYDEYRETVNSLYSKFDLRENRQRMANFKNELENIKGDSHKLNRERDRLMRVYEAKKNDLKTIENNMGFFNVKSSAGNSMVKEMERRIKRLKEEMAEVESKIRMLDED